MELKKLLLAELENKYRAEAIIKAIEKDIAMSAKGQVEEKYKGETLNRHGVEYEVFGVNANCFTHNMTTRVQIQLTITIKSKLTKIRAERLSKFKADFNRNEFGEWSDHKIPLWETLSYIVDLDVVFSKDIRLEL